MAAAGTLCYTTLFHSRSRKRGEERQPLLGGGKNKQRESCERGRHQGGEGGSKGGKEENQGDGKGAEEGTRANRRSCVVRKDGKDAKGGRGEEASEEENEEEEEACEEA